MGQDIGRGIGRRAMAAWLAGTLAGRAAPVRAQDAAAPWAPDAAAPEVAGIRLGDPAARVIAVLGEPEPNPLDDPAAEVRSLRFHDGALMALIGRRQGVARILLNRPEGGRIAGVRVGDPVDAVLAAWGAPSRSNGATGLWLAEGWLLAVRIAGATQTVDKLLLIDTTAGVQPTDLPLPAWLEGGVPAK